MNSSLRRLSGFSVRASWAAKIVSASAGKRMASDCASAMRSFSESGRPSIDRLPDQMSCRLRNASGVVAISANASKRTFRELSSVCSSIDCQSVLSSSRPRPAVRRLGQQIPVDRRELIEHESEQQLVRFALGDAEQRSEVIAGRRFTAAGEHVLVEIDEFGGSFDLAKRVPGEEIARVGRKQPVAASVGIENEALAAVARKLVERGRA